MTISKVSRDDSIHVLEHDLVAAGATPAIRITRGELVASISGTGTIAGRLERSTRDPANAAWAPVEDTGFSGALGNGIAARTYVEPGIAWWRFNLTSLDAGTVKVSIMGPRA